MYVDYANDFLIGRINKEANSQARYYYLYMENNNYEQFYSSNNQESLHST